MNRWLQHCGEADKLTLELVDQQVYSNKQGPGSVRDAVSKVRQKVTREGIRHQNLACTCTHLHSPYIQSQNKNAHLCKQIHMPHTYVYTLWYRCLICAENLKTCGLLSLILYATNNHLLFFLVDSSSFVHSSTEHVMYKNQSISFELYTKKHSARTKYLAYLESATYWWQLFWTMTCL